MESSDFETISLRVTKFLLDQFNPDGNIYVDDVDTFVLRVDMVLYLNRNSYYPTYKIETIKVKRKNVHVVEFIL